MLSWFRFHSTPLKDQRGLTLIEVVITILLLMIAGLATLSIYSYGVSGIEIQGNRRAALEASRSRIEELLSTNLNNFQPVFAGQRWLTCAGSPCTWTFANNLVTEQVSVNDVGNRNMITTVQWIDDPTAQSPGLDALEFSVRTWFTNQAGIDDDQHNNVHIRALRAPL